MIQNGDVGGKSVNSDCLYKISVWEEGRWRYVGSGTDSLRSERKVGVSIREIMLNVCSEGFVVCWAFGNVKLNGAGTI